MSGHVSGEMKLNRRGERRESYRAPVEMPPGKLFDTRKLHDDPDAENYRSNNAIHTTVSSFE